jgi:trimeric autotransporter adhesin
MRGYTLRPAHAWRNFLMNRSVSLLLCLVAACGDNLGPEQEPSPPDASPTAPDARVADASAPDAVGPDAAPGPDADAVPPDAVPPDAVPPDAVPPDAVPPDAVPPDAFPGNPNLAALVTARPFDLEPAFDPAITSYTLTVSPLVQEIRVAATPEDSGATIQIDGEAASAGALSAPIALGAGDTLISVQVRAPEGLSRTYDITVDRTAAPSQRIYGKASNAQQNDQFGWSVALSGDTLAVGAPLEDSSATGVDGASNESARNSGAVYVFRRVGTAWQQEAYIKASNTELGDDFGWSVALSGDVLVVGAPFEDSNATGVNGQNNNAATDSGAAYVFRRSGGIWAQEAYIKASNTGSNDAFGHAVAVSGDTVAVSAYLEDSSATGIGGDQGSGDASDAGAVYVFRHSGGTWAHEAYVKASNTGVGDQFGHAVAISGDTLAVGARGEDSAATGIGGDQDSNDAAGSGAVYVYTRSGAAWTQQAYVKASNTGASDEFGATLALAGNLLAVGAQGEDSSSTGVNGSQVNDLASGSGAVYVFRRSANTWTQEGYVKASNTGNGDAFGSSLDIEGEILAVGARNEDSSATGMGGSQGDNILASNSGAVYVFRHDGTRWSQIEYAKSANTGASDAFGTSVGVSRDALAVGSTGEASNASGINGDGSNNDAPNSGAAYAFH